MTALRFRSFRLALACVVWWVLPNVATASPVRQRSFQETQKVHALAQTPDGFLWVGTDTGLLRFDGRNFSLFTVGENPGLKGNIVRALHVDRVGMLWLGLAAGKGIVRVSPDGEFYPVETGRMFHGLNIDSLAMGRDGVLWVLAQNRLIRIDDAQGKPITRQVSHDPKRSLYKVHADAGADIYLCAKDGLFRLSAQGTTRVPGIGGVSVMASHPKKGLWLAEEGVGLVHLGKSGQREVVIAGAPGEQSITALGFDTAGELWLGWGAGHGRLRGKRIEPRFTSGLHTVDLAADSEGGMWVATYWGVVSRFAEPRLGLLTYNGADEAALVFSVNEDAKDNLWLSQTSSVVQVSPDGRSKRWDVGKELPFWCPRSALSGPSGQIWISSCDDGVVRLDDDGVVPIGGSYSNEDRYVMNTLQDDEGNLWVGTDRGRVYLAKEQSRRMIDVKNRICSNEERLTGWHLRDECSYSITAMERAHGGGVWMAIRRFGLRRAWADGRVEVYLQGKGLPSNNIISIMIDRDDRNILWLGTQAEGLIRFENGVGKAVQKSDGLPAQSIHGVTQDDQGRLWMTGEQGIFRVDKSSLMNFFSGKSKRVEGFSYGVGDGLPGVVTLQAYNRPIVFRDSDHRVFAPTDKGLVYIDAHKVGDTTGFHSVIVNTLRIGGEDYPATRQINVDLDFREKSLAGLEVEYTTPGFEAPQRLRVRSKLVGFSDQWQIRPSGEMVRYRKLPPGRYRLELQAMLDEIPYGAVVSTAPLVVKSYYAQPIFFVILIVSLAFVAGGGYILRLRYRQGRVVSMIDERNRIARELHDSLAQYFTGLAFQLERIGVLMEKDPEQAARVNSETKLMLAHCRLQARQDIHNLRAEAVEQASFAARLYDLATEAQQSGEASVQVQVMGEEPDMHPTLLRELLRVVQEALVNALTHGKPDSIIVSAVFSPDEMDMVIEDDGAGMPDDGEADKPMHYGLQGMRERSKMIGAKLNVGPREGGGTMVSLSLRWVDVPEF